MLLVHSDHKTSADAQDESRVGWTDLVTSCDHCAVFMPCQASALGHRVHWQSLVRLHLVEASLFTQKPSWCLPQI